jgi:hypothetical protein
MIFVLAPVGLAASGALFLWFRRLIRSGRSVTLAAVLIALIVVETVLYEPLVVPIGLFHLHAGPLQVRTIDLVLLLAVVARASVPDRRPFDLVTGAWLAFAAWLTVEAVIGIRNGNPHSYVSYHYKVLLYLGVAYAVATARIERSADLRPLVRLVKCSSVLAGALLVVSLAHATFPLSLPGLHGAAIIGIGAVSASLFPALGVLALVLALCADRLRYDLLLASLPLMATVLAPSQRASILTLAVSLVALLVLVPLGRRHLNVTPTQVGACFAAVALVGGCVWVGRAALEGRTSLPFAQNVALAVDSQAKAESAQDRVNQLEVARKLIAQRPVYGWGLGKTITYYEVGFKQFETIFLTHNIVTDLLLRTGIVGLLFFAFAVWPTLNESVKTWRDPGVRGPQAALALASTVILVSWLSHGMVESMLEHVRLTPLAFVFVGLARAARFSAKQEAEEIAMSAPTAFEPRLLRAITAPTRQSG